MPHVGRSGEGCSFPFFTLGRARRGLLTQQSGAASANKVFTGTGSVTAAGNTQVTWTKGGLEPTISQPGSAMLGEKTGTFHSKCDHLHPLHRDARRGTCETTLARGRTLAKATGSGHPDAPPCSHRAPGCSRALQLFFLPPSVLQSHHPNGDNGVAVGQFLWQDHLRSR